MTRLNILEEKVLLRADKTSDQGRLKNRTGRYCSVPREQTDKTGIDTEQTTQENKIRFKNYEPEYKLGPVV